MASELREVWGDLPTSAFIGASLLFKSLDDATREDLVKLSRVQTFAPGEVLVRQGEAGGDLLLVRDGQATVSVDRDGERVELAALERGAIFGELLVLGEPACAATVRARTELTVVRFPAPMVAALAERFPRVKKLLEALREARRKDVQGRPSA